MSDQENEYAAQVVEPCPRCGTLLDSDICLDDNSRPAPGDLGLCLSCGLAMIYQADLSRRAATEAELQSLPRALRRRLKRSELERRGVVQRPKQVNN